MRPLTRLSRAGLRACLVPLCAALGLAVAPNVGLPTLTAASADEPSALAKQAGEAKDPRVLLKADNLIYRQETDVWVAQGNVEADYAGKILRADELTYEVATGRVVASGNVTLIDPKGETLFADRIELQDDLRDGVINSLQLLLQPNAKLAAARAVREGGKTNRLEKAVYSPCEICEDEEFPLWQVRAEQVVQDEERKEIIYKNARFEVYGVSIAWLPYFSHPDPSVKRLTGFLTPTIGNSSDLGNFVQVPYYWALKPNMDLTLTPMITSREGLQLASEFRHNTSSGGYEVEASITYGSLREESLARRGTDASGGIVTTRAPYRDRWRGHLFAQGDFAIDKAWDWGFDIQYTSDDTYLRRYDISRLDRLTSNLYLRGIEGRRMTSIDAYAFEDLREGTDEGQTPIVPGLVDHRITLDEEFLGGSLSFRLNGMILTRTEGRDVYRASLAGTWRTSTVTDNGQVIGAFAQLRSDLYGIQDAEEGPFQGDTTEVFDNADTRGRVLPTVGVEWRWPFVRQDAKGGRQIIEPVVQLIASPYGGNPGAIPNEDSTSFEFDETNLFAVNRFPGLDRWEGGMRANVGVRARAYWANGGYAGLVIGQTLRLREDDTFSPESGLDSETSDIVGRADLSPVPWLNLTHRFRMDPTGFDFNRNEVYARIGDEDYWLTGSYVRLDKELSESGLEVREELNFDAKARLTEYWSFLAGARRDLDDDQMISQELGFEYLDECLQFQLTYRRRFTRDRDIEPSTSIIARFRLITLGG